MIMTDRDNNQITAFHPGAMMQAHGMKVQARPDIKLGIISPDGRDAMLQHAQQFKAAGIPFVFDPGQGLPMFDGKELAHFIDQATWVTVNDYEGKMLSRAHRLEQRRDLAPRAGPGRDAGRRGLRGVDRRREDRWCRRCKAAGDRRPHRLRRCLARRAAVRAGAGLAAGAMCAQLGNKVGAIKIASRGPQNYTLG